jgi:hypothetical protein
MDNAGLQNAANNTRTQDDLAVPVIRELFTALHDADVKYCHWKSNEHLSASMLGLTDLDILIEPSDADRFISVLERCGFREFDAPWFRRYPHIRDWIALDAAAGLIVHIHAHFQLVLGESGVKSYCLPWADDVLGSRIHDRSHGVFVADPAVELLLLIVRATIKCHSRSWAKRWKRPRYFHETSDESREFAWLKSKVSEEAFADICTRHLPGQVSALVLELYRDGLSDRAAARAARALIPHLEQYRRMPKQIVAFARAARSSALLSSRILRRLEIVDVPIRRRLRSDGLIICVLGSDGSGKSTLAGRISSSLAKKIDVIPVYMGAGDGPSSLLRRPLVLLRKRLGRRDEVENAADRSKRSGEAGSQDTGHHSGHPLVIAFNLLWGVTLALEKRAKLLRADRARARGMLVVTDRYPQMQVMGFNDGPLLSRLVASRNPFAQAIGRWETRQYQRCAQIRPDLAIKLIGTPETLRARRPGMDVETILVKQDAVAAVDFRAHIATVTVDADQAAEEVFRAAMGSIGSAVQGRRAPAVEDGDHVRKRQPSVGASGVLH